MSDEAKEKPPTSQSDLLVGVDGAVVELVREEAKKNHQRVNATRWLVRMVQW